MLVFFFVPFAVMGVFFSSFMRWNATHTYELHGECWWWWWFEGEWWLWEEVGVFSSSLFFFLSFLFWIQVWELGANDNCGTMSTRHGGPHGELSNWKRYSAYAWEDFVFLSSLSLHVSFCVIVQVIDGRSIGPRRFVCVFLCVCMSVFLLMVQVPHEIRNVILDFGPTMGCS